LFSLFLFLLYRLLDSVTYGLGGSDDDDGMNESNCDDSDGENVEGLRRSSRNAGSAERKRYVSDEDTDMMEMSDEIGWYAYTIFMSHFLFCFSSIRAHLHSPCVHVNITEEHRRRKRNRATRARNRRPATTPPRKRRRVNGRRSNAIGTTTPPNNNTTGGGGGSTSVPSSEWVSRPYVAYPESIPQVCSRRSSHTHHRA
jgi:hypothetical protein